ncbi:MAG: AraC family transcriptional regulator [Lachnospiraceae bacterium]|nr:AraC family transcriptional regulator [Lachnospiraceae bacterium]
MEEARKRLEEILADVPDKRIRVRHVHLNQESHPPHADKMRMGTDGKGLVVSTELFPGIELSLQQYHANRVVLRHDSVPGVVEIHHCRSGRCGLNLADAHSLFLGEGDVFIQTLDQAVDSEMTLPLGYYEGINIQINLEHLNRKPPEILKGAGLDQESMMAALCPHGRPVLLPPEHDIEHIFKDFYDMPEQLRLPYYRIKTLELLLYLSLRRPGGEELTSGYQTSKTERISQIHEYLTSDLTIRPTIEELSQTYHMNTTTLKELFRAVYGQPIATYMKEFRMRKAMDLLAKQKFSISETAALVGYENQSKFTAAFKQFTGELPREYRNRVRAE